MCFLKCSTFIISFCSSFCFVLECFRIEIPVPFFYLYFVFVKETKKKLSSFKCDIVYDRLCNDFEIRLQRLTVSTVSIVEYQQVAPTTGMNSAVTQGDGSRNLGPSTCGLVANWAIQNLGMGLFEESVLGPEVYFKHKQPKRIKPWMLKSMKKCQFVKPFVLHSRS